MKLWGDRVGLIILCLLGSQFLWTFFAHTELITPTPRPLLIGFAVAGALAAAIPAILIAFAGKGGLLRVVKALILSLMLGIIPMVLAMFLAEHLTNVAEFAVGHTAWKPSIYRIDHTNLHGRGGPQVAIDPYGVGFGGILIPIDKADAKHLDEASSSGDEYSYCVTVMEQRAGSAVRIQRHKTSADPYGKVAPCPPGLSS